MSEDRVTEQQQEVLDLVSNVIWYVKGLVDADQSRFSEYHIRALADARAALFHSFMKGNKGE